MDFVDDSCWDAASAIRERLYLLAHVANLKPEEWRYDPRRDMWIKDESGQTYRVRTEGSASLKECEARGIARADAMRTIGYPER